MGFVVTLRELNIAPALPWELLMSGIHCSHALRFTTFILMQKVLCQGLQYYMYKVMLTYIVGISKRMS